MRQIRFIRPGWNRNTNLALVSCCLLLITFLLNASFADPVFTERYYSRMVYPKIGTVLRNVSGVFPFSIGDVIYVIIGAFLLFSLIRFVRRLVKKMPVNWLNGILKLFIAGLLLNLWFNISWGYNYHRQKIAMNFSLPKADTGSASFVAFTKLLLDSVNTQRVQLPETFPVSDQKTIARNAYEAFKLAANTYPLLSLSSSGALKPSIFGGMAPYIGFTGYFNPFTGEAQVCTTYPQVLLPYTAAHEIGHQIGFAKEDEASFAGYLAAIHSPDITLRYSAHLEVFMIAFRKVQYRDTAAASEIYHQLSPGVLNDYKVLAKFYKDHRSPLKPAFRVFYTGYLKSHKQPMGLQSYNDIVSLVRRFYIKKGLI